MELDDASEHISNKVDSVSQINLMIDIDRAVKCPSKVLPFSTVGNGLSHFLARVFYRRL